MLCTRCGKETPEESTFCLHCGKPPLPVPPRLYSPQTLALAIGLTAVVVIATFSAVYGLSASRGQGTTSAATSSQSVSGVQIAKPSAAVIPPREFTSEELFNLAAPSVVLIELSDESGEKHSTGSGFVVESGTIVTNYHVIRGAYSATVRFSDGSIAPVSGVLGVCLE